MLYFERTAGEDEGLVRMPPLTLHWLAKQAKPTLLLFRHVSCVMTPRDNESTVVSTLMHRMAAMVRLGQVDASVSDLGIPTHDRFIPDTTVELPTAFGVADVRNNIDATNFGSFASAVRGRPRDFPTAIAYINKPTAAFADAFILLPNYTIFIQEKQSVVARRAHDAGATGPRVPQDLLTEEYNKLGDVRLYGAHVFLLVTDASPSKTGGGMMMQHGCVVDPSKHDALMGTMCAALRRMRMQAPEAEAHAADAAEPLEGL